MAALILRAPGMFWLFLLQNSHDHKIPRFSGGLGFYGGGGRSANFIFMGAGIFLNIAVYLSRISNLKDFFAQDPFKTLQTTLQNKRTMVQSTFSS